MEDALAANADVLLRIDVQGAATVRGMMPGAVSIFLVRLLSQHTVINRKAKHDAATVCGIMQGAVSIFLVSVADSQGCIFHLFCGGSLIEVHAVP